MESYVKKEWTWSHPSQVNILVWQLNFSHSHKNIYFKHKLREPDFQDNCAILIRIKFHFLEGILEGKQALKSSNKKHVMIHTKLVFLFFMHAFSFLLYSIPIWRKVYSNRLRKRKKKSLHWLTDFIVMYSVTRI